MLFAQCSAVQCSEMCCVVLCCLWYCALHFVVLCCGVVLCVCFIGKFFISLSPLFAFYFIHFQSSFHLFLPLTIKLLLTPFIPAFPPSILLTFLPYLLTQLLYFNILSFYPFSFLSSSLVLSFFLSYLCSQIAVLLLSFFLPYLCY